MLFGRIGEITVLPYKFFREGKSLDWVVAVSREGKNFEGQRCFGSQSGPQKELFGLNSWKTYELPLY